jgi:ribonuclease P protein component
MLPYINRVTKKKDFDKIFKNGFGAFNKAIGIKAMHNNLKRNRYGIIVGIKISKLAVTRNKIKRQIREILKDKVSEDKSLDENTKDYVIITLPSIKKLDFLEIKKSIEQNLNKLANIKQKNKLL